MTLTEEQRAALKRVAAYMDEMYSVASPYHGCTEDANLLRAMIDSSGTVEPTGGFDLERARGLRDFLQDDCAEVGDIWGEMIAEIERLRAENEEALESLTAAYLLGRHEKAQEKEGKIGPDARPPYWQITEERKAAIWHAVAVLKENDPDDEHLWDEEIAVLRAMLKEAE